MKAYHSFLLVAVFAAILTILCACSSEKTLQQPEPEIAQWRGDMRDGVYHETGLLNEWPENGPEMLWSFEGIGKGYASPAILNDRIFVNGEQDSTSFLFCFDMKGKLLWKSPNGREFMGEGFSATYPGSRSTPTVVDNLVYTTSGKGRIACFDANNGEEQWAIHIVKDLGGLDSYFGYSESLVVDGNKVYCFPGGEKNNTVALDRFTGEKIWSNKAMQDTFSYCSPVLVQLNDKKVLLTHSRHFLYTLDAANGSILGQELIDHYQYDGEHCNTPLYADGSVFFIGNEKEDGAVRWDMDANGKLNEVWRKPKIKNNFNGFVKVDNCLFTLVKGNKLQALDIKTGERVAETKAATGSIIYADNKFYCYGMNGDVNLITYSESAFKHHGTFKVNLGDGHHFAHPVISNGQLFIRHGGTLMAYKI